VKEGEIIVLVSGVNAALVLLPAGDGYRLIGPVYVHRLMDGRFVD